MQEADRAKQTTRIHIDRQPYESPNPTIGAALYELASVPAHFELFRETSGDHEDELVPRDGTVVRLVRDDHFYSQHEFKIIVNGRPKETPKRELSFAEVVHLAFEKPPTGPYILFTITYRNGPPRNPSGTLTEGNSVFVKNGMIFNVTATDKS